MHNLLLWQLPTWKITNLLLKTKMVSETNENKLFKLKHHLKVILEDGLSIVKENNNSYNVYHNLFNRYVSCFESIKILINDFEKGNTHRSYPIAIILRASLLDYLTTLYLRTFYVEKQAGIKSEKSSYEEEYDKLLTEQIRRLITVSERDKKSDSYNHKVYCNFVDKIYIHFNQLFDKSKPLNYNRPIDSLIYKRKDDIKPETIRKRLDSFAKHTQGIDYLTVFTLYDLYSKYDHFGTASILFANSEINDVYKNMFWAIFHITDGLGFCIDFLKDEVKSKIDFSKIDNEIKYLRGTLYTDNLYLSKEYKERYK